MAIFGYLLKRPFLSKLFMMMGINTIPGIAIPILLRVTMVMPSVAATLLLPTFSPCNVSKGVPCNSSCLLISGMLIQLAALQAMNGTSLPTSGGRVLTEIKSNFSMCYTHNHPVPRLLRPSAVTRAPPVAAQ